MYMHALSSALAALLRAHTSPTPRSDLRYPAIDNAFRADNRDGAVAAPNHCFTSGEANVFVNFSTRLPPQPPEAPLGPYATAIGRPSPSTLRLPMPLSCRRDTDCMRWESSMHRFAREL